MANAKKQSGGRKRVADNNPEWTEEDFAKAKPFSEVFPELAASIRRGPRPQARRRRKCPCRSGLSPEVVAYFKAKGPGWQSQDR